MTRTARACRAPRESSITAPLDRPAPATVVSSRRAHRVRPAVPSSQRSPRRAGPPLLAAPSSQRSPRRAGPPLLALAAALGLLAAPRHALAAPTIEWHAPAGCPDAAAVHDHILRVVGPDPLAAADALLRVQARVLPHGDAWLLVVVFTGRDATRERRLTLRDCASTVDATALLVACGGGTSQVQVFKPARLLVFTGAYQSISG